MGFTEFFMGFHLPPYATTPGVPEVQKVRIAFQNSIRYLAFLGSLIGAYSEREKKKEKDV